MHLTCLAIDNTFLPLRKDLCLYLQEPAVRTEPVLSPEHGNPDAPDNAAAHFYGTVLHDGGLYRMWYYACHWADEVQNALEGRLATGPVCYAESDDGLTWRKPALGQVDWRGNRANNVIRLSILRNEGVHVIRDDDDPDPGRRYKMVYNDLPPGRDFWTIRTATSPDGLQWTDGPALPYDAFFEQGSFYRFDGHYYANGQIHGFGEGGGPLCRQAFAILSPDFTHWLPECGESFLLPEPADPALRGSTMPYDQVHLGIGAASLGNVLVGLYCQWHNQSFPTEGDWFGLGTSSGDFGLVVSNDGLHFREPVKGHTFLHRRDSRPQLPAGTRYETVLCQGNGILNIGDETRIYHGRWANTEKIEDYHAEVALATLPRDRWGALGLVPDAASGSVWTAPMRLPAGGRIILNADDAAGLRVEVGDEQFVLLPAFAGARAGTPARAGGLSCPVHWTGRALDALAGQSVRFRIIFTRTGALDPRLYACYLTDHAEDSCRP